MTEIDLAIIGGGVIGLAVARAVARTGLECAVLEQSGKFTAENQSSRNSGVIHAGIYYDRAVQPNKARLCVQGNRLLYEFCRDHRVPAVATGKLVVASRAVEIEYLTDTIRIARENGVPFQELSGDSIAEHEPNVKGLAALLFPTSGIVEATELVRTLARLAGELGAYLLPGTHVKEITPQADGFIVRTVSSGSEEIFKARRLINAAGLYSDDLARMIDPDFPARIDPARGEAVRFSRNLRSQLTMKGMNVYPAPYAYWNETGEPADVTLAEMKRLLVEKKVTRTVGVHLTPTFDLVDGEYRIGDTVTIGPEKTVGLGKEDLATGLKPTSVYVARVQRFFPGIREADLELHQAGIAASLAGAADWMIEKDRLYPDCIHLVGIDSPGLTACLAIAEDVVQLLEN